jgi:hypothetical protein
MSSKLVEMDWLSLPIEVEEGLGRRSAVAEAILWAEQETGIVMMIDGDDRFDPLKRMSLVRL